MKTVGHRPEAYGVKRILFITDPIGGSYSVQLDLLAALGKNLQSRYRLVMLVPYCCKGEAAILEKAGFQVLVPPFHCFALNRILDQVGRSNESMLWGESWLREALLRWNGTDAESMLRGENFDFVLNMSSTVAFPSNLWWIQGTPLDQTIRGMGNTNLVARLANIVAGAMIARLDRQVIHRIGEMSEHIVASSPYVAGLFRERHLNVDGVIFSTKDFSHFRPVTSSGRRDYVLLYVGKEMDCFDVGALVDSGVQVVGFGGKIPTGTRLNKLTHWIDFKGCVSETELVALYSNALYTLFPFTVEAFGWVPIESMACGTPVLTYDRQGPAITVVDGRTGWLVRSPEEMLRRATQIWRRGITDIAPEDCVRRASEFSVQRSVSQLVRFIESPVSG
jgi:glycosyltransferase involved in cell wall biosynthesis